LKHNKREKKAFAQGLSGGTRSRRTPWGCLARKNANIPEVVKVNNYLNWNFTSTDLKNGFGGADSPASKIFIEGPSHYELFYSALP
jgi:hypothetical protein